MTEWDGEAFFETGEEILCRLGGRLSGKEWAELTEYLWEEDELFAELLAAALVDDQIPVSAEERDLMRKLLGYFRVPGMHDFFRHIENRDATIAALNVVEEP